MSYYQNYDIILVKLHFKVGDQMKNKIIPHTYIILLLLVFLACLMTYIIPAGQFDRVFDEATKQTLVVSGSYYKVENTPIAPYLIFHKFYEALSSAKTSSLIFFILLIGGTFEVILKTECLSVLCEGLLSHLKSRELWIIPIFVCLFSIFGFTMGLTTASVVFVPIGIAAAKELGIPKMCGMAMVALGTNAGFTAGIFNPFSVGTAQMIAEIPLYSGAGLRWVTLLVLNLVTSLYLMYYASKHRVPQQNATKHKKNMALRQKLAVTEFVLSFIMLTFGIIKLSWGTNDIVVMFLITGVIMGISSGFTISYICEVFTDGCKRMVKGVLIIGIAATIRLVLTEGNIMDTITHTMTQGISYLPLQIQLLGMFLFNASINFLITSGSAKAALVMPLLTPMADTLGISRQSAVFAFQLGDGLTNLASPISTTLNGVLAVAEEPYEKWIHFYIPLVGIYILTGGLLILLASLIGY